MIDHTLARQRMADAERAGADARLARQLRGDVRTRTARALRRLADRVEPEAPTATSTMRPFYAPLQIDRAA